MALVFKSWVQILEDMVAHVLSNTPITDINAGSVFLTVMEACASEDYQQYLSMVDVVKTYNLDTTTGSDLDERALEFGISRLPASKASGFVTVSDSAITQIATEIFAGQPGPIAGQTYFYITDATGWTPVGSAIVGRETTNNETVVYTGIVAVGSYFQVNLAAGLTNDHGTSESVILSQGGLRTVSAGIVVYVPATDINPQLNYSVREDAFVLNGDHEVTDVIVDATNVGTAYNVPTGAVISFGSLPFPTALVDNPMSFTNGRDVESDQELRDRIKDHIQSLSRGTKTTVLSQVRNVTDATQQATVVSTGFIEATVLDQPSYLFIDDGTGFEATWDAVGYEVITQDATGGERYMQLDNYPLVKASLISRSLEPYDLSGTYNLVFAVNDAQESVVISSTAFRDVSAATAEELAAFINASFDKVEARTTGAHKQVIVQARDVTHEKLSCVPYTNPLQDANNVLNFVQSQDIFTLNLCKNDVLLSKDGNTAFVTSVNVEPFALVDGDTLFVAVDGTSAQLLTFLTAQFVNINSATALEVCVAINGQLAGATASVDPATNAVIITSNRVNSVYSQIEVTAAGTSNPAFDFPLGVVVGSDANYYLNRYNGQIKLLTQLLPHDKLTAGTNYTRGMALCTLPENYVVTAGNIQLSVDGGAPQTLVSPAGGLTAAQMASALNLTAVGCTFFDYEKGGLHYLGVRTNTWGAAGSISIIGVGTTEAGVSFPSSLTLPSDVTNYNQTASVAFVESARAEPFFGDSTYSCGNRDQYLMALVDGKSYRVLMQQNGTVSTSTSNVHFHDATLGINYPVAGSLVDCDLQFDDNTTTVALRNEARTITVYTGPLGGITVGAVFSAVPAINDTFKIYPRTAKNVIDLMLNPHFTTLGIYANIEASSGGTYVTLSSLEPGSAHTVQVTGGTSNSFSIPFATDGTLGGQTTVNSVEGLSVGAAVQIIDNNTGAHDCFIATIVGAAAPYTIQFDDQFPAAAATDASAYSVGQAARIIDRNGFHFTTVEQIGIDGYKNYTGLLREAQRTLDGWDEDLVNYPGFKAAGVQIEILPPVVIPVRITVNITTDPGVALGNILNQVKATISSYINSLVIGQDVVLTEITYRLQQIQGVYDVEFLTPTVNIPVADNALARVADVDIVVG